MNDPLLSCSKDCIRYSAHSSAENANGRRAVYRMELRGFRNHCFGVNSDVSTSPGVICVKVKSGSREENSYIILEMSVLEQF